VQPFSFCADCGLWRGKWLSCSHFLLSFCFERWEHHAIFLLSRILEVCDSSASLWQTTFELRLSNSHYNPEANTKWKQKLTPESATMRNHHVTSVTVTTSFNFKFMTLCIFLDFLNETEKVWLKPTISFVLMMIDLIKSSLVPLLMDESLYAQTHVDFSSQYYVMNVGICVWNLAGLKNVEEENWKLNLFALYGWNLDGAYETIESKLEWDFWTSRLECTYYDLNIPRFYNTQIIAHRHEIDRIGTTGRGLHRTSIQPLISWNRIEP